MLPSNWVSRHAGALMGTKKSSSNTTRNLLAAARVALRHYTCWNRDRAADERIRRGFASVRVSARANRVFPYKGFDTTKIGCNRAELASKSSIRAVRPAVDTCIQSAARL